MAAPPIDNLGAVAPLLFVIALLCMPSGIGGGVLFVPVLRLIGGLSLKESTALSQALIASASLAATLFNFFEQYRARNEPKSLIVWPFVILILPGTVIGSLIGVYIYSWLPSLFVLILYFCFACLGSFMAFRKGFRLWKAETRAKKRDPDSDTTDSGSSPVEAPGIPSLQRMPSTIKLVYYMTVVAVIWAICLIFPPLTGNSSTGSVIGVPYCEAAYWVLAAVQGVILLLIPAGYVAVESSPGTIKTGSILMGSMIECGVWLRGHAMFLSVIGLISSIVGTSGGLFMIRVVLSLGLDPKQSTATTAIVIFATSTSTALSFALGGYFPPASDMWITVMPFAGALLGKTIVAKLLAMTGRLSVLVLLLGTMVAIGGITTITTGIISAVNDANNGGDIVQFGSFC